MRIIPKALSLGLRVVFYIAEVDDCTPEPGPCRIMIFKYPFRNREIVAIASGSTMDDALADLETITDEVISSVGKRLRQNEPN